jgi:hypothetical protein
VVHGNTEVLGDIFFSPHPLQFFDFTLLFVGYYLNMLQFWKYAWRKLTEMRNLAKTAVMCDEDSDGWCGAGRGGGR